MSSPVHASAMSAAPVAPAVLPQHTTLPAMGAEFHGTWNYQSDAQRIKALDTLRAAGGTWVRQDMRWADVQSTPGSYSQSVLAQYDHVIALARSRGLKVLLVVHATPVWASASGSELSPPSNVNTFASFVRDMSLRYAGKVGAIELWNEENSADFFVPTVPGHGAAQYVAMERAAYTAVKTHGATSMMVMAGGTSYVDDAWWRQMYQLGIKGYTDAVAVHPYMSPSNLPPTAPDDGGIWTINHLGAITALMKSYGDASKPIWATEMGWSTHARYSGDNWNQGVSEATQARYADQTLTLLATRYPQVKALFWYNLRDRVGDSIQNDNYGLLRRDLTPKPIVNAMRTRYVAP